MFESIDAKIMAALTRLLKGELNRRVQQEINTAAKVGKQLKGRQALWVICRYYATKDMVGVVYGIPDLMEVKWAGDEKAGGFLNTWRNVVEGVQHELDVRVLEELLLVQIMRSDELKPDVDYYKRLPPGHEDRSYAFLKRALERVVECRLKEKNRENDLRVLRGQVAAPGAGSAGAGGGGRGHGNDGDKGKGKGKSVTLCRFFVKGCCKKGQECEWSHDSSRHSPAPRTPRSQSPGKGKGRGKGRGKGKDRSPSAGRNDKQRPCWKFQTKECPNSSNDCRWAHRKATAEELAARPPQRSRTQTPGPAGGKSKAACFEWQKGMACSKGDKCRYAHNDRVASPATTKKPRRRRSRSARAAAAEAAAAES